MEDNNDVMNVAVDTEDVVEGTIAAETVSESTDEKPETDTAETVSDSDEEQLETSTQDTEVTEPSMQEDSASESEEDTTVDIIDIDRKVSKTHEVLIKLFELLTEKEKKTENLSDKIDGYRKDLNDRLRSALFSELIGMRNSMVRNGKLYEEKGDTVPIELFKSYAFDLQDIFESNGFEIYASSTGDSFDPRRQSVIKKVSTGNKEEHGKIAYSVCDGYAFDNKTVSAEKVAVYFYSAEENTSAENDNTATDDNNESEENSNE